MIDYVFKVSMKIIQMSCLITGGTFC